MPEIRRYDIEITLIKKNHVAESSEEAIAHILEDLNLNDKNHIKNCIKIKKAIVERSDL